MISCNSDTTKVFGYIMQTDDRGLVDEPLYQSNRLYTKRIKVKIINICYHLYNNGLQGVRKNEKDALVMPKT